MFGKLLKYELKAINKPYIGLYVTAGILSVIIGFWLQRFTQNQDMTTFFDSNNEINMVAEPSATSIESLLFLLTIIGFAVIISAIFISTFFLIVNRFRKSVYGRQGYLTMTLPVTNHQIILSKLCAGMIWNALSTLTTFLCIGLIVFILILPTPDISFGYIMNWLANSIPQWFSSEYGSYFLINTTIGSIHSILLLYFAISLGQLFKEHSLLLAIVFYFGIYAVESIVETITLLPFQQETLLYNTFNVLLLIAFIVTYYLGTHYIMSKKLNLQ